MSETHLEKQLHSYVIRAWYEPTDATGAEGEWRGSLTDVFSLEQHYFREMSSLVAFLSSQLVRLTEEGESSPNPEDEGRERPRVSNKTLVRTR